MSYLKSWIENNASEDMSRIEELYLESKKEREEQKKKWDREQERFDLRNEMFRRMVLESKCLTTIDWIVVINQGNYQSATLWDSQRLATLAKELEELLSRGSFELQSGVVLNIDDNRIYFSMTPEMMTFIKEHGMRVRASSHLTDKHGRRVRASSHLTDKINHLRKELQMLEELEQRFLEAKE